MSRPRSDRPRGEPPSTPPRAQAEPKSSQDAWARAVLAIVVALALALRLAIGLRGAGGLWFEEDVPVRWAFGLWGFDRGRFDPDPHSALWPHLSVYVYFLVQLLQFALGRVAGTFVSLADFRAAAILDPHLLRASAVLATTAIGGATIVLAAQLARRLGGSVAAVLVAAALAIDPVHVRYSLVPSPDLLVTLFVELGMLATLDVRDRARLTDSLRGGLWMGLGIATKFSPALLAIPLTIAHLRPAAATHGARADAWRRLGSCAGLAIVVFLIASPFTWLDFARQHGELRAELAAFAHGPFGAVHRPAVIEYATSILPGDLGWPLALSILAGLVACLVRPIGGRGLLLAFALPYAAILGAGTSAFPRYLLPLLPLVLALAAAAVRDAWSSARRRPYVIAAVAASCAGVGWNAAAFMHESMGDDRRELARAWCVEHVSAGAVVAVEALGPELPDADERLWVEPDTPLSESRRDALHRGPSFEVLGIPMTVHDPATTATFYDLEQYLACDYVITSSSVRGRYEAEPASYPVQADFYRALERLPVAYRSPARGALGPEIVVYHVDSTSAANAYAWWRERAARHPSPTRLAETAYIANVFADRAFRFGRANRIAAAARQWPPALAWENAPGTWWYHDGLCLRALGDDDGALVALREGYRRDSTFVDTGLVLAELAAEKGRRDESRRVLERVLTRGGLDGEQRARAAALEKVLHEADGAER